MNPKHSTKADDNKFVVTTKYGTYTIDPFSPILMMVDGPSAEHGFILERRWKGRGRAWWCVVRSGGDSNPSWRVDKALIAAVTRWIGANRSRLCEMARKVLEEETPVVDYSIEEETGVVVRELRARIEVLKAVGGTLSGIDLRRYERALDLLTSTIDALQKLKSTSAQWMRGPGCPVVAKQKAYLAHLRKQGAA